MTQHKNDDIIDGPTCRIIDLDRIAFEVRHAISRERLAVDPKFTIDEAAHHIAVRVRMQLVGKIRDRIDVEERWPVDWWQAVRERWLPAWWLRRWPVAYRRLSIHRNVTLVCPHIAVPETGRHLKWVEMGGLE